MSLTLFDCLGDIIKDKTGSLHKQEGFKKAWSNYMILRYLSMDDRFRILAAEMNKYQEVLTSEQMYLFLVSMVPRSSKTFIKYIKQTKPKTKK